MTFHKRSDNVSSGYQIPVMPRVPRSAKGKRSARNKIENNQVCAFDLLAALAGKILAEKEEFWSPSKPSRVTSTVYSNIQEQVDNEIPLKGGIFDQRSCDESTSGFPIIPNDQISHTTKQNLKSLEGNTTAHTPAALAKSDASENDASCKLLSSASGPFVYDDSTRVCTLVDPIDLDRKAPATISSDGSMQVLPYGDCCKVQDSSFPSISEPNELLHVDRDGGENSSWWTHPNTFNADCAEDHRRKRILKLNYRKADPVSYNDGGPPNDDMEIKPVLRSQRLFYTRQKHHRGLLKRRTLSNRCSVSPSCGSSRDAAMLNSPVKDVNRLETASDIFAALNGANNIGSQNFLCEPEDHPVKLSIKSFEVPELFVEMPANATVGSLKRTVMEAVMAILGDGLHVGVLLQGKKVRDDNKTLIQAGISYEDKINSLGFTLEPDTRRTPRPHHCLKEPALMPSDPEALYMIQDKEASETTFRPSPIPIPTTNCIESDHENSVHSPIVQPSFPFKKASDSNALVPMPAKNPEALSITPTTRKPRRSDTTQRRIRRPFSVLEVEALVHAVEKLGTGRWRDVKLRAFGNCKHRTYVDLKDKWKTLVHTASISPRHRRGEPVPQELLDRVLSAHANWSNMQARLPSTAHVCLLLP